MTVNSKKSPAKHSLFANLAFNIIIPTLILTKLSGDNYQLFGVNLALGAQWALVVALAFPLTYGIRDLVQSGKVNFFSVLGIFGVLVNGGVGLLEGDRRIIIFKEAAIPAIIGLVVLVSLKTRYPLIKALLFNDQIVDTDKINQALEQHNGQQQFQRRITNATYIFFAAMMLSALLNYILADTIITADTGTAAFNEQLGKMQALSFPVIALPVTAVMMFALFYLFRGVSRLTGMPLEEIIRHQEKQESNT